MGTVQCSIEWLQPGSRMRRNETMVLTQQSALTQKLRLEWLIGCTRSWQFLLNGSIFPVQNLRGLRRLSPRWLCAWQQWLMAICRGVPRGARGAQLPRRRVTMGGPNDCGGRRKVQKCHKCFLQCSTFSSPRPQFQKICFPCAWNCTSFLWKYDRLLFIRLLAWKLSCHFLA